MNIIVKQTSIVIDGYELGDCPKIEGIFSVYNMATHTSIPKGIEYIPEKKQLILPRGIDIPYIKALFNTDAYLDRNSDPFDKIGDNKLKYPPRDDEQKEALKFMESKTFKPNILLLTVLIESPLRAITVI